MNEFEKQILKNQRAMILSLLDPTSEKNYTNLKRQFDLTTKLLYPKGKEFKE